MIRSSPEDAASPAEAPAPTLDTDHLGRMTMGDTALEREVLQLFDHQTAMLAERLHDAPATVAASCAHTLKGSARGIGAWRLAQVAEQLERALKTGEPEPRGAIDRLVDAVAETRAAIADRLLKSTIATGVSGADPL
jgi:HPt (histidine-containing phosphotransfer) domain-containing protein